MARTKRAYSEKEDAIIIMMAPLFGCEAIAKRINDKLGVSRSPKSIRGRMSFMRVSSKDVDGYTVHEVVQFVEITEMGLYKRHSRYGVGTMVKNTLCFSEEEVEGLINLYGARGSFREYMTLKEFGAVVGFSKNTIRNMVNTGVLADVVKLNCQKAYVPKWLLLAYRDYMNQRGAKGNIRIKCQWSSFIPWAIANYSHCKL